VRDPTIGMRPRRYRPRGYSLATPLTALLLVATLGVALPAAGVAAGSSLPSSSPLGASASGILSPSAFAERAGYPVAGVANLSDPAPASGSQQIEITFEATNPTFYDAPSPGAAPMTDAEIANEYGLSPAAYASAEQYFTSEGLTVTHSWPDRLSLSLEGSASAVDRAFGTELESGSSGGQAVTFPATAPSLPAALEGEVTSVAGLTSGLDQFTLPELPAVTSASSGPAQSPTDLVTPEVARDIYSISPLYNLTQSPTYASQKAVVLLLWGEGYSPSDIQTFFSQYYPSGFPAPNVVPYPVDGAPNPSPGAVNDPSNATRELTLDIEWAGSMAPGATLDAVYAPDGPPTNDYSPTDASMIDALNLAVDQSSLANVAAISMSFGSADGQDPTLTTGFENDFSVAAREGISVFAATGDFGGYSESGCQGSPEPEYPSASPQVVAVGGTSVTLDRSLLGSVTGFSESAWSQSGGGYSAQFAAPSWQEVGSAAAPIEANGHRGMPDVAATADYNFLYFDGAEGAGGGTSFATPLWAGMVTEMDALHGSNFGFIDPELYALGANNSTIDPPFHDITTGGNCLGSAEPGWDTATGWGSPDGVNLYEHLVASFVNLTLEAGPSPVLPGGTVTITATLTNYTSGAPISGVAVSISLSSSGIGGPCSGTFGTALPTSNGSGSVRATISVPYCYLGATAVASAMVSSGGYYASASSGLRVNLLGLSPVLSAITVYPNNVVFYIVLMAICITAGGLLGRRPEPTRRVPPGSATAPRPAPPPVAPAPAPPPAASAPAVPAEAPAEASVEPPAEVSATVPISTTPPSEPAPSEPMDLSPDDPAPSS
jgi:kumamolisin